MVNFNKEFISGSQPTPQEETAIDFNSLPRDVALKIFSYLNAKELTRCQQLNKKYKELASNEALWNALPPPEGTFDEKQWEKYIGNVGKVPPLPKDIHKILKSPCPFWPRKKVEETHMLVLIPKTVNDQPLTLAHLGELVKAPKEGHAISYRSIGIPDFISNEHYQQATPKSHWVLMTKDVIEGSIAESYPDQQARIAELNKETGLNYEVPNVLDAAICIFMHYVRSKERLFNDKLGLPYTFTRCQENINGYLVGIGYFTSAGLCLGSCTIETTAGCGVGALRKFF